MASVLDLVKHYQHSIEKYQNDEHKILKCIDKLYNLAVTVQHLQETGVGRTVNALRKEPGDVGQAARALVYKWKVMVAAEESDQEETNNDTSNYNGQENEKEYQKISNESRSKHDKKDRSQQIPKTEERHKNSNGDYGSKRKYHSSEEDTNEPETKKSKYSSTKSSDYEIKTEKNIKSESCESQIDSQDDSSQSDSDSEDSQSSEEETKPEIKVKKESIKIEKEKHESSRSKYSSSNNREKQRHDSYSENVTDNTEKHHRHKSSEVRHSEKHSSKDKSHRSSKDNEYNNDKKEHRLSESEKSHKNESSTKHSDKHRSTNGSEKDKSSSSSDKHRSISNTEKERIQNSDKHKSSVSSEKYSSSSHRSSKSTEKPRSSHSEKPKSHTEKCPDSSSKSEKDKHKHSSDKQISSEKSNKSSSNHSNKDKYTLSKDKSTEKTNSSKEKDHSHRSEKKHTTLKDNESKSNDKRKSDSHDDKSSKKEEKKNKSKSSSSKGDIRSKDEPKKKNKRRDSNDGIDCGSGASFAEALGMISPPKPKKKPAFTKDSTSSPTSNDDLCPALLAPTTKLAPLPALEISALPEISPNYRPRPPPKFLPHFNEEEAISAGISSKNQRTKVYSGNKVVGKITTLYEMCVHVLQEHIDALEYTGGVPYEILKPVVDRATPQQLFVLEHYNPYLMEDTDHLWQKFCEKSFRSKKRQEMETWREMYMRCQEEQEIRLKSLTANIKIAQEAKKAPIKQTKMAYVDSVVKPPRNIAKKQAQHGTAYAATASPAARVASLAAAPNVLKGGRATHVPTVSTSSFKPKKAPLMQKALQVLRGRKR